MKVVIAVLITIACVINVTCSYTSKYDSLNLDEVLSNKRLLTSYIKCLMEKGRCTPEGKELKAHISEALQNGCEKCTNSQQHGVRRVIKHLMKNEPQAWNDLVHLYDPDKTYSKKYEKELKSI